MGADLVGSAVCQDISFADHDWRRPVATGIDNPGARDYLWFRISRGTTGRAGCEKTPQKGQQQSDFRHLFSP